MSTGNGFNKVIMYILPSRQEREILFEATRTCVWLVLDVDVIFLFHSIISQIEFCLAFKVGVCSMENVDYPRDNTSK